MAAQRRLKPLKPGSRIRAVNPITWMDLDTDLQASRERFDQQQWHLEIPAAVTRQWRYFSGADQERVENLRFSWNDPTVDAVLTLSEGWGAARGPLVVTNLALATQLIGTPWIPSLKGAILVLKEVGEAPYRVDRMLTKWHSEALLKQLAGVA